VKNVTEEDKVEIENAPAEEPKEDAPVEAAAPEEEETTEAEEPAEELEGEERADAESEEDVVAGDDEVTAEEEPVAEEEKEMVSEDAESSTGEDTKEDEGAGGEPAPEQPKQERPRIADLPKPVEAGDELEVTIESVGAKGDGIAKKDGFVIFIPGVQKGETVKIKITEVKTSFATGEKA
jgi:predicted RNA-binding protein with TRAM domain